MNIIFPLLILAAFGVAGYHQLFSTPVVGATAMEQLSKAVVDSAGSAVQLALGLIGVMTLFLGLMKVAEAGGVLRGISRLIRPLMVRLFPDVPPEHPAMGAMILNISANVLGLGNAATPFGIRAMQELEKLNRRPGTATDAMVLFLAINTSSVTLLPTGVIALRAAAGSANPAGILPTTLFATACSTLTAVLAVKAFRRFYPFEESMDVATPPSSDPGLPAGALEQETDSLAEADPAGGCPLWVSFTALGVAAALIPLTVLYGKTLSPWVVPGLIAAFLCYGIVKKVSVYEVFVEGAKDGFHVAARIIPYLVAILTAVGMLRASGAMEAVVGSVGAWTARVGLPAEGLLMGLLRPLSGSGAYAVLASFINDPAIGPDSYTGYLVSTIQGCTETTFYVLAVYFGSVQVKRIRHALIAGLAADIAGVAASVVACRFLYG